MAQRTALLNGNNINRDTDFSKYIESLTTPGVIEGLAVTSSSVAIGKAWVPCERTNGDTIYALFYNTAAVSISGNGDVYIEVDQAIIDNGELGNEDGTGIAEIKVGTMPSKNALKLATISNGTVTDARVFIKKVDELNTEVQSIFTQLEDLDERVEHLEEADAIDHLEESGLVGELYTLNDTLFKQETPTLENSTLDANIGDVAANTQVHIQRIASGVASNQLKLKLKMVGASTQNLVVEVRKGTQVTVTANQEAYWYGSSTVIASGSIPYTSISSDYSEITVTLNNEFGGTKGELLDVVLYMASVNATNYYCVACDETQYSEAFSYVSVDGSKRTRYKLMPYCISDGFLQSLIVKVNSYYENLGIPTSGYTNTEQDVYTATEDGESLEFTCNLYNSSSSGSHQVYVYKKVNGTYTSLGSKANFNVSTIPVVIDISGINAGEIIAVSTDHGSYGSGSISNVKLFKIHNYAENKPYGYPKTVEGLGQYIEIIIFGMKDGEFVGKDLVIPDVEKVARGEGTTTSVTTGSKSLGNAVGFLIIDVGGNKYKVPYYS